MVNSVLDSLLVYLMSSLQLPQATVEAIYGRQEKSFLLVCRQKQTLLAGRLPRCLGKSVLPWEYGGLGIRDLGTQNVCLLLKLIHRLHCSQSSAWAQWIQGRASVTSLQGDLHRDHWHTLRSILPLYQAITSVSFGNGKTRSFWHDVWIGDEPLADRFPSLLSHCTNKTSTLHEVKTSGIQVSLVHRLSAVAQLELHGVEDILHNTELRDEPDKRCSPFLRADNSWAAIQVDQGQRSGQRPKSSLHLEDLCSSKGSVVHVAFDSTEGYVSLAHGTEAHCRFSNLRSLQFRRRISGAYYSRLHHRQGGLALFRPAVHNLHGHETAAHVSNCTSAPVPEFPSFIALICWHIWKARNTKIFNNEAISVDRTLSDCKSAAQLWHFRLPRRKRAVISQWCSILEMARTSPS